MKRKEYGKGLKVLLTVMQQLFVLGCVICMGFVSSNALIRVNNRNNTYHYYVSPFTKSGKFEDSDVFHEMLKDNLNDIIRYCVIRDQMETNDVFDENKPIDIEQYARHFEELPVTDTSVAYTLGDLIQWGQYGITVQEYSYEEAERMIAVQHGWEVSGIENTETAVTVVAAEETAVAVEVDTEAPEEYVLEMNGGWNEGYADDYEYYGNGRDDIVQIPVEKYTPADGRPLLSHVDSVQQLQEMMQYLKQTVSMLSDNYNSYKEYKEYYDHTQLNFKYCITQEKQNQTKLFSNLDFVGKDPAEIDAYFSSLGRYLCFAPAAFTYESNTSVREERVRDIWNTYRYAYPDHTRIWVGVDTSYAYDDAFSQARTAYNLAAPGYLFFAGGLICAALAFVLLIFMTYVSGHRKGVDGISTIYFDRLNTETAFIIASAILCTTFLLTCVGVHELYYYSSDHIQMLAVLVVGTFVTNGLFLFFYLSLVRRIKAGTFWSNFLIYRFWKKTKGTAVRIYDNRSSVVRVWFPYVGFLLANLMLFAVTEGLILPLLLDVLVGVVLYRDNRIKEEILEGIKKIRDGNLEYQIDIEKMHGDNRQLAEAVNSVGNGIKKAVEISMKDERMKADLITNVSHDIKTPLTSIINYVDLIKREPIENDRIKSYVEVLDNKSQRLKQLTEDLVEASKISSGNIELQMERINFVELMNQTVGEFVEKFDEKGLQMIVKTEEVPVLIYADSRRIWRVVENLFNNIYKYAMEKTRVYVEMKVLETCGQKRAVLSLKNISAQPLNVDTDDLMERFIRGDVSRTTEGSGLGLSIAKNLTELQKGSFELFSDGDLFKVTIAFPLLEEENKV